MRFTTCVCLVLGLAAAPGVAAQSVGAPAPAEQPVLRMVERQPPVSRAALATARAEAEHREAEAVGANAAREISARAVFTIIGVVVVAAALISLLI